MKKSEKEEIKNLPSQYKPLGAWKYFWLNVLFMIPIIGWICLIVFACSSKNIIRRSYARSFFCAFLIIAIVVVIVLAIFGFNFAALMEAIKNLFAKVQP